MSERSSDKMSVWLDCDTGHDDAFAILLAAYNPVARLLGVSTVHGNASLEKTTHNTRAVLRAIGRADVPVLAGFPKPLVREPLYAADIHGESGLGGVTLLPEIDDVPLLDPMDTVREIVKTIMAEPKGEVWIVATGPLTNIAKVIEAEPNIVNHIAGLSIMGGAIGGGYTSAPLGRVELEGDRFGNTTPFAEFNIYCDPEAGDAVFRNKTLASRTTLIPLDLTHLVRGDAQVRKSLFGMGDKDLSLIRRLFHEVMLFFKNTYAEQFGIADGPPLHDPLALYAAVRPDDFQDDGKSWDVSITIERDGWNRERDPTNRTGQTVLRRLSDVGGTRVPINVNLGKFWAAIEVAMEAAEERLGEFQTVSRAC